MSPRSRFGSYMLALSIATALTLGRICAGEPPGAPDAAQGEVYIPGHEPTGMCSFVLVEDSSGDPVEQAEVSVAFADVREACEARWKPCGVTNLSGAFSYRVAPERSHLTWFAFEAPGFGTRIVRAAKGKVIRLRRPSDFSGSIRTPFGDAAVGVSVQWPSDDGRMPPWALVKSDTRGRFTIPVVDGNPESPEQGADDGEWTFEGAYPGHRLAADLQLDSPTFIVRSPIRTISGLLLDDRGRPEEGAGVRCPSEASASERLSETQTDATGFFRLRYVGDLRSIFVTQSAGKIDKELSEVAVPRVGARLVYGAWDVGQSKYRVRIRAVPNGSARPMAAVPVRLERVDRAIGRKYTKTTLVTGSEDGAEYVDVELEPGTYAAQVASAGGQEAALAPAPPVYFSVSKGLEEVVVPGQSTKVVRILRGSTMDDFSYVLAVRNSRRLPLEFETYPLEFKDGEAVVWIGRESDAAVVASESDVVGSEIPTLIPQSESVVELRSPPAVVVAGIPDLTRVQLIDLSRGGRIVAEGADHSGRLTLGASIGFKSRMTLMGRTSRGELMAWEILPGTLGGSAAVELREVGSELPAGRVALRFPRVPGPISAQLKVFIGEVQVDAVAIDVKDVCVVESRSIQPWCRGEIHGLGALPISVDLESALLSPVEVPSGVIEFFRNGGSADWYKDVLVVIDGRKFDLGVSGPTLSWLRPGLHRILVGRSGHQARELAVVVDTGRRTRIEVPSTP